MGESLFVLILWCNVIPSLIFMHASNIISTCFATKIRNFVIMHQIFVGFSGNSHHWPQIVGGSSNNCLALMAMCCEQWFTEVPITEVQEVMRSR